MDRKGLRTLLVIHGFITLAASIVLTVAPGLIPSAVGIHLAPSADVVAYLLAVDRRKEDFVPAEERGGTVAA